MIALRYSIAISGVGGLGILTLGRIISLAAIHDGKMTYMSEIHGLSQRYGSVFVHVRISDGEILAPTIPSKGADLLIGLEPIESLRVIEVMGPNTIVVLNTNIIPPPTITLGISKYPPLEHIIRTIRQNSKKLIAYNALELAKKLGEPRLQNTILLGIVSELPDIPISTHSFRKAIENVFSHREKILKLNLEAFEKGRQIGQQLMEKQ